ncbi:hypothetical protein LEMLEM_LOCUS13864 [Lemmus lemmus]
MQDHHNASNLGLQHTRAHGIHPSPGPERLACCLMAACAVLQEESRLQGSEASGLRGAVIPSPIRL